MSTSNLFSNNNNNKKSNNASTSSSYNREQDVRNFEDSKLGVKGLIDSGITYVPRMFHHPIETLCDLKGSQDLNVIPAIDLSGPRHRVLKSIKDASSVYGFFQIINHGVPVTLSDDVITVLKAFHEMAPEEKRKWYHRDFSKLKDINFFSNHDLFRSKSASWRNTVQVRPRPIPNDIPSFCRNEIMEWDYHMKTLGHGLLGLFSEGLGLPQNKLKKLTNLETLCFFANYYPHCPEPTKTIGIAPHTDPGVMTDLLQDMVGGLQVEYGGKWLNLKPVRGALVVNIGDLLQIISNDAYKSGLHRVVTNPSNVARLSVAVAFGKGIGDNTYGPLPELVSPKNPPLYNSFKFSEFYTTFFTKELEGKTMTNYYRKTGG